RGEREEHEQADVSRESRGNDPAAGRRPAQGAVGAHAHGLAMDAAVHSCPGGQLPTQRGKMPPQGNSVVELVELVVDVEVVELVVDVDVVDVVATDVVDVVDAVGIEVVDVEVP